MTQYGAGEIELIEKYSHVSNRIGVRLEKNPFSYSPVCFFQNEVKQIQMIKHKILKGT